MKQIDALLGVNQTDLPSKASSVDCARPSFGFVMWVDVLGFRNLMKLDPTVGMGLWPEIWAFLNQTKSIVEAHEFTEHQVESVGCKRECFEFTSFSDSIVFTLDLSRIPKGTKNEWWNATSLFIRKAAYLCRKMFDFGLPVRGGIDCGDFYHQEGGFAGAPFVEAEDLSSTMELSACLFTKRACKMLDELYEWLPANKAGRASDWFEYDCEMKIKSRSGCSALEKSRHRVLDIYCRGTLKLQRNCEDLGLDLSEIDLGQSVKNLFSRHGKSIAGDSVERKINNTVMLLEYAKSHRKGLFG
jgi:hypothetical protein